MKKLLLLLLTTFIFSHMYSQFIYKIKADSVLMADDSCSTELIIENSTKNVKGILVNKGNGRTEFRRATQISDSSFAIAGDTIIIRATESGLIFSTGLTKITGVVTANLSTGIPGGQSVIGGTGSGNHLTLSSTSNGTKGKILMGSSGYDETANRLGIGTTSPAYTLDVVGRARIADTLRLLNTPTGGFLDSVVVKGPDGVIKKVEQIPPAGIVWTGRTPAADLQWNSVTYGNGLFVAVGITGTGNRVMTSPDGVNWTIRASAADNYWFSVTYGNGLFVAVAATGTDRVMTSPDGINWTIRTVASDNSWQSVTYGNGLFVAVGGGIDNVVMTSPDGINWTLRTSPADKSWRSVTYGNGLFVAVAIQGTNNRIMTSPDGINWTLRTSPVDNNWESVTYGNGLYVAVATSGTGNRIMTSPDGINWTLRTSPADNYWCSVTYGGGLFVAVAVTGSGNRVMTSPNGIDWTLRASTADIQWLSVVYANGMFVAVSQTGTGNGVMTSGKETFNAPTHNNTYHGGMTVFGNLGVGVTSPTASLHLKAGTATANTAPLKLTSGTNLTTPEAGAIEFDGTNYFATSSTTRHTLSKTLTNTASLNFPDTSPGATSDLTITVTGAAVGDVVHIGVPTASVITNGNYTAFVSATNTVTIRFSNIKSSGNLNPASGTFRAVVTKY